MTRRLVGGLVLAAAAVLAAATVHGGERLPPPPELEPAATVALSAAARRALGDKPRVLASDSLTRRAQELTLRVRNISCEGVATGSGWAIDAHTLITNRHVLAGAAILQLNAWDGTSIEGDVSQAKEGRLVDIGIATIPQELPVVAKTGPRAKPGAKVTAVGYPLGGELTLSPGRVVRYLDGRALDPAIAFDGEVMELSTTIKPGNSGGPVLDAQGRVVGVIYAGAFGASAAASLAAYAIPLEAVRGLLDSGGTQAVLPCAQ